MAVGTTVDDPAHRNLCVVYGVIAFVALIATWWNNIAYSPLRSA
ncbi:hypothetical protein [Rhodococcus daqingensis]|uniref:Uncharacterized protein n=1 Tax=Rhodococcus daqingensis TaxID=2479363 RepID=A0ABW2S504_9NOCA